MSVLITALENVATTVVGHEVEKVVNEVVQPQAVPEFTINAGGGKKQTGGKATTNQVPEAFVQALSAHMDAGAKKYGFGNHAKGLKTSQAMESIRRHYTRLREGEDIDPETGSSHFLAIAANAMMVWALMRAGRLEDDRKGFYIDLEYGNDKK